MQDKITPVSLRRRHLGVIGLATVAGAALGSGPAFAQSYPNKVVKLLVPYAPGGAVDIMARLMAKELATLNGQPYVVDNKGGAGGAIAAAEVAHSAPDGYTILVGATGPNAIVPALYGSRARFDPLKDLIPVSLVATTPYVLVVNPALPVKSVAELIAYAKTQSGKLNFSSAGTGGPDHLAGELFKQLTGVQATHVAYKGSGPSLSDLVAGQVQYSFVSPLPAMPLVEAGKLRLLAVTGRQRSAAMPSVPTVAETVPGFEVTPWYGFFVPAGTPQAIVAKIAADAAKVVANPDVQNALRQRGLDPQTNSPAEFDALLRKEIPKWTGLIKDAGLKPD
jgi:tripartite-type tricarboxylate transporter receptor subunit TctC